MNNILILACVAAVLVFFAIKKHGLASVWGIIVVRDIFLFGIVGLVFLTLTSDELSWNPLVREMLSGRTEYITQYSLLAFLVLLFLILASKASVVGAKDNLDQVMGYKEADRILFAGCVFVLIGVAINVLIYGLPNQIGYFSDAGATAVTRAEYGAIKRSSPMLSYINSLFLKPILLYVTYKIVISYEVFYLFRKTVALAVLFMFFLIITWEGQKAPLVTYAAFLFVVNFYSGKKISFGLRLIGILFAFFFVVSIIKLYEVENFYQVLSPDSELFTRLIGQPFGVYYYDKLSDQFSVADILYEAIPAGSGVAYLIEGVSPDSASRKLMNVVNPGSDTSGVFNTYYFGQGLVLFGVYGWLFSSIIVWLAIRATLWMARIIGRKWNAYGRGFIVGYLGLYVFSLSGDLTPYLFGKILIQTAFNLILISFFWKVVTSKSAAIH